MQAVRTGERPLLCVTYNIQFGIGMDGKYDLARIAGEVRGADLIALQEVSRHNPQNGGADMVAELESRFPDYFHVFDPPFKLDVGSRIEDGRAISRHFEFGNMVLSRTPILSSRNLLLPRSRTHDVLNLQRSALEAMVETPLGPVRFYSVHLNHTSERERIAQIECLKSWIFGYRRHGGAATGVARWNFPEPPHPEHFVLLGDFNLEPESRAYDALCGERDPEYGRERNEFFVVDVSTTDGGAAPAELTWFDPKGNKRPKRLDYCFASASIAPHCRGARVDGRATGSDHRPLWMEIG